MIEALVIILLWITLLLGITKEVLFIGLFIAAAYVIIRIEETHQKGEK